VPVTVTVPVPSEEAVAPTVPVAGAEEEGVAEPVRETAEEGEFEVDTHVLKVMVPVTVTVRLLAALEDTEGDGEAEREFATEDVAAALGVAVSQGRGVPLLVALTEKEAVTDAVDEAVPVLRVVAVATALPVGAGLADALADVVPVATAEGEAGPDAEAPTDGVATAEGERKMEGLTVAVKEPPPAEGDAVPHCEGDAEGQKVTVPLTDAVGDVEPCPPPEEGEDDAEREYVPVGLTEKDGVAVSVTEVEVVTELQRECVEEGDSVPVTVGAGQGVGVAVAERVTSEVPVTLGVDVEVPDTEAEGETVPVRHEVADADTHEDSEGDMEEEPDTDGEPLSVPLTVEV
jgi:hypothetical protein